ncbi:MAG: TIGR01777 family oxidoreductase [Acidobacteriales bacterium]|nr:TIGR01777 family oxidoreductase [Terriglobales bacterium]
MRILVSGASGLIGSALRRAFSARGYEITRLGRGKASGAQISWNPAQPLNPASVSGFDAVVHLAGESIAGRWTESKKREILESRVQGTRNLADAIAKSPVPPRVFIAASAIGFYGDRGEELLREDSRPGEGFLPQVCTAWEAAAEPAAAAGIRTVHTRFGIVLSRDGGALAKMLPPFRLGVGGRIGSGRQWMSWIAIEDLAAGILHLLENDSVTGPLNFVSPQPVRNEEFTRTLASVLHRPAIFPVPAFAVRLAFGQMGEELLLSSQKVEPSKLLASGYVFDNPDLAGALRKILA